MPKKRIIKTIIILILLCFVCKYIYDNYKVEHTVSLVVNENEECDTSLEKYYTKDDIEFYLYCLDEVTVDFTDRTLELNKALEARQIDIDSLKKMLSKKEVIKEDKAIFYKNDDITMLECINKDKVNYIIGKKFEYIEGMCNSKPYLAKFEKEYYILDISKSKNKDSIYLTLRDDEIDEVVTLSIPDKYELEEDKLYIFTFGRYHDVTYNDIKTVFEDNILLSIDEKIEEDK